VRWLQKDETTFYMDELERRDRWQYYISSYMRVEPTEGVDRSRLQKTVLARNLPSASDADSENGDTRKPLVFHEGLVLRICVNSAKIVYEKGTSEYFIYDAAPATAEEKARHDRWAAARSGMRSQRFMEKMLMNVPWMKDMSREDVQKKTDECMKWMEESATGAEATMTAKVEEMDTKE